MATVEAKFIKCKNIVVNVNDILSIDVHEQELIIECTNKTRRVYFASDSEAEEELNRIYNIIK